MKRHKQKNDIRFEKPRFWARIGMFFTGDTSKYITGEFSSNDLVFKDKPLADVLSEGIVTVISIILVLFVILFSYGFVSAATNNRIPVFDINVAQKLMDDTLGNERPSVPSEIMLTDGTQRPMDAKKTGDTDTPKKERSFEQIVEDLKGQPMTKLPNH